MNTFVRDCLLSGLAGGVFSHLATVVRGRAERGDGNLPMHDVSHIAWGDHPASHTGRNPHNALVGAALHHGASVFWATFFEALFGRRAERNTKDALIGGATIAAAAYVTDYHIVSDRFKPGFEAHLSNRSLVLVYVSLALGFAAAARLRGLYHHQVENKNERDESRHPERGPDRVVSPE